MSNLSELKFNLHVSDSGSRSVIQSSDENIFINIGHGDPRENYYVMNVDNYKIKGNFRVYFYINSLERTTRWYNLERVNPNNMSDAQALDAIDILRIAL